MLIEMPSLLLRNVLILLREYPASCFWWLNSLYRGCKQDASLTILLEAVEVG